MRNFVAFLIGLPFLVLPIVALIYAAPALAAQIGSVPVAALIVAVAIVALVGALAFGRWRDYRKPRNRPPYRLDG